jgi:hypothetical protein
MFQPKGGIYELSLDTPQNWSDKRSVFGHISLVVIPQNETKSQEPTIVSGSKEGLLCHK